jgi:folylpolyglutamate synthase
VDVRERIRVNGNPLRRADFVRYFWVVYEGLQATAEGARFPQMPGYFRFITLVMFQARSRRPGSRPVGGARLPTAPH